ncbi:MAG: hypothetical protein AB1743_01285 [Actinomycetota bacterium]
MRPFKGEGIFAGPRSSVCSPPSRGRVLYGLLLKGEGIWLFPSLERRLDSVFPLPWKKKIFIPLPWGEFLFPSFVAC